MVRGRLLRVCGLREEKTGDRDIRAGVGAAWPRSRMLGGALGVGYMHLVVLRRDGVWIYGALSHLRSRMLLSKGLESPFLMDLGSADGSLCVTSEVE